MRLKTLLTVGLMTAGLISGTAFADIRVKLAGDICDALPGNWAGTGDVTAWNGADCKYNGTGAISKAANGHYAINMDLEAQPGQSSACISTKVPLDATCSAGQVVITNSGIDLSGEENGSQIKFGAGSIYGLYKVNFIDMNKG